MCGVVNVNGVVHQYCHSAMSVSSERLCQFIVDLISAGIGMARTMSASWIETKFVTLSSSAG